MNGAIDHTDHLGGRMYRQRMRGRARSGRNVVSHFSRAVELMFGGARQQRYHQIFQRDHADVQLCLLGTRQCTFSHVRGDR